MFLTGLLFRTFLVCFLMTQIHLPRSGPGPSKNYSKDVPQTCLKAGLMEALSRLQFSSQVIWVFVKLIKANQNRKFIVLSSLRMVSVSQPRSAPGFYGEKKKKAVSLSNVKAEPDFLSRMSDIRLPQHNYILLLVCKEAAKNFYLWCYRCSF